MKGIALETIARFLIVAFAALIAIGLLINFNEQIRDFINKFIFHNDDSGAITVESENFTTPQVKTYIMACWDKYQKKSRQNKICYVLLGRIDSVYPDDLLYSLDPPALVDTDKFDNLKNTTIIKTMANGIVVEST